MSIHDVFRFLSDEQKRKRRWIRGVEILLYVAIFGGGLAILGVVLWLT